MKSEFIQKEKVDQRYCWTHQHKSHHYSPWAWGYPYVYQCDICGHHAAWTANDEKIALCDCCAHEWMEFPFIRRHRSMSENWNENYAKFKIKRIAELRKNFLIDPPN